MSATQLILDSIRQRLLAKTERYEVELFPEDPENYRLNAEDGAILVQYAGSKFHAVGSSDLVQQRRDVYVALTIISRSQHGDVGALDMLDQVRLAIVGFRPTNCEACALESEQFDGEYSGLWQYQLLVKTETWQIEQAETPDLTKFVETLYRRRDQPLLQPTTPTEP